MMKFLLAVVLFGYLSSASASKTYEVTLEACEAKTSCSKCMERIKMHFTVDEASKSVTVSATKIDGSPLREVMEMCEVRDANNWVCTDFWLDFEVKNGLLALLMKDPYKGKSEYEVCQVKD
jgi:hypothetical protein